MSFLAPFFLLGALAVGLPVLFHLIRRTSRDKVPFSSLMFLQPSPPRMTRKSRLEHLLLLLLRCLVVGLLALGFARPFFQRPIAADTGAGAGARIVILVDASASMKRDNLWNDAKARVDRALRQTSPADSVTLAIFDRTVVTLLNFEQWSALPAPQRASEASRRLDQTPAGWGGTHLGNALLNAVEWLEEKPATGVGLPAARRILLVTDLQEGTHLDGLQGFEWPRGVEVIIETVSARRPTNAGLQILSDRDEREKPAGDGELRVRIHNAAGSRREQFQIGWARPSANGFTGKPVDAYVPPSQSRVVVAPKPDPGSPSELLRLTGDDEEFDNVAAFVAPRAETVKALYLGKEEERDSTQLLFYLRRAFQQTQRRDVQLVSGTPTTIPAEIPGARLVIITDPLADESVQPARRFLEGGGTVLFVMKAATASVALAQLAGVGVIPAEEIPGPAYALLGQIDFEHPLFAPFADPRFSDFTKIHFWQHRRLDLSSVKNARVVARFDKGDPALIQFTVGRGTLLALTSGWHPVDSQLALSTKFVPLLYAMLELGGGASVGMGPYIVGDPVVLTATNSAGITRVRRPDGRETSLVAGDRFTDTDMPGVYSAILGTVTNRFAVNLDPAESRTDPLPIEQLERLGVPLKMKGLDVAMTPSIREHLRSIELEQRQKLWRWLLIGALLVLVMETWIAGRLTRPAPAPMS
ncbi:MAG: hypothetical protein QOF48_161 [Verrucomicrobiota bacterium]|jgi:hypothetical protein